MDNQNKENDENSQVGVGWLEFFRETLIMRKSLRGCNINERNEDSGH
jgi:hypothetical protein